MREIYRSRWRKARDILGFHEPTQDGFAIGGLCAHVPQLAVRLLILPRDPEAIRLEFDEALWNWWKTPRQAPFGELSIDWGNTHFPSSGAAIRCLAISDEKWESYLALMRHGGLDMSLGRGWHRARRQTRLLVSADCRTHMGGSRSLSRGRDAIQHRGALGVLGRPCQNPGRESGQFRDRMGPVSRSAGESPRLPGAESPLAPRGTGVAGPRRDAGS